LIFTKTKVFSGYRYQYSLISDKFFISFATLNKNCKTLTMIHQYFFSPVISFKNEKIYKQFHGYKSHFQFENDAKVFLCCQKRNFWVPSIRPRSRPQFFRYNNEPSVEQFHWIYVYIATKKYCNITPRALDISI